MPCCDYLSSSGSERFDILGLGWRGRLVLQAAELDDVAGGLILGVVESIAAQFVTATSAAIFSIFIFIQVLFFRPTRLMGMKV
jgi:hypothetical protein